MHSATSLLSANLLAHTHHLPVYCFRYYYCCCCSLSHIFWTIQVLFGFHSHSFWGLHLIIQILVAWKSPFWQMMKARRSLESLENGISQQNVKKVSCSTVLTLAYQSLGVVYGDLSTSPLYVYKTTFSGKLSLHEDDEEIFGVLSFIFWTFTLIALFKYVFIVISANDNGEGGTFALYSLLCRHARLSILPNQEETDEALSSYAIERPVETWQSSLLKSFFEKHPKLCKGLLIFVLLGTCMAIDDGIFTPAISVLSAVSGVKVKFAGLHENYIVIISCIILVGLFSLQHHGTHRVAFMFAPVVTAWLLCIGGIGAYNIFKWNPCILHALSPSYMLKFLRSTGTEGWVALGGVVLSITGVEAMFADLGHFSALSIKIAFTFLVYPCLVLAYLGEAAFLSRHHQDIQRSFYKAIPEPIFWPVFIVATFAAVIGSQAAISATFSIISQCCALSCFPKVKIVHTSSKICGQIYIPEINWMLMCLCLSVTIGLRDTNMIGHAYGLAVTTIMFVTTCLMAMVMVIVWKQNIFTTIAFMVFFGSVELLYFSAALFRVPDGGWVPLVLSSIFMSVMFLWNYGTLKKHQFDVENKVSMTRILSLGPSLGMVRVPGIGLVYTNLVTGVPAVFGHFITNLPAFHQVVIFICIKSVQVPYIGEKDRFLVRRVGPKEYSMFKCIVRYGYKDLQQENYDFENRLVCTIIQFVEREGQGGELQPLAGSPTEFGKPDVEARDLPEQALPSYPDHGEEMVRSIHDLNTMEAGNGHLEGSSLKDESMQILRARESGIAHILGHSYAQAKKSSSVFRKFAIDVVYAFLSKNCREPDVSLDVPYTSLLEVGMIYYV